MKKAKIILSAIGILSVISGAFAFKAQRWSGTHYCTTLRGGSAQVKAYTTVNKNFTLYCSIAPTTSATILTTVNFKAE